MKHYLNDFHGKFIQIFLITCKFCEEYIWVYKTGIQQKKENIFGSATISRVYKVDLSKIVLRISY